MHHVQTDSRDTKTDDPLPLAIVEMMGQEIKDVLLKITGRRLVVLSNGLQAEFPFSPSLRSNNK